MIYKRLLKNICYSIDLVFMENNNKGSIEKEHYLVQSLTKL